MHAENKEAADLAIDQFEATYGAKYPKAVDKVLKDRQVLVTHFDFPVEHWIHLRTTNVIESTFATVRLRTNKTKGAGSRSAGLAMAYKLLDAAQLRWRCVNAPHLVALLRAEATGGDDNERETRWTPRDFVQLHPQLLQIPRDSVESGTSWILRAHVS